MTNYELITERFKSAMSAKGIEIEEPPEADGNIHRVYAEGDKPNTKNAWYVLRIDEHGIACGAFGHWAHEATCHNWTSQDLSKLSESERLRVRASIEAQRKLHDAALVEARSMLKEQCNRYWSQLKEASPEHPYLARKQVKPHGIRQDGTMLVIPVCQMGTELVGLQRIFPDGQKRFVKGTPKQGNYYFIGKKAAPDKVLICEGFATAASVHEATGFMSAVAFDAGNLSSVALSVRSLFPGAELIICADNDGGEVNTGVSKAKEAAAAVGGRVAIPPFPSKEHGTDFNDLHVSKGKEAVLAAVEAAASVVAEHVKPPVTRDEEPGKLADIRALIRELAQLSHLEYVIARKEAAKRIGITLADLDRLIREEREGKAEVNAAGAPESAAIDDGMPAVEPWPEPVNAAELLDEIVLLIHRHIVIPRHTADASALWIAFTWLIDSVKVAPIAMITAPEKRCGKTQLLSIFIRLCRRPLAASNISPTAIYRCIEAWRPTLLIDEADAFLRTSEDARGILNSGHTRDTAFVVRNVEFKGEIIPRRFSTWGAKAIAGIGTQAETLMDRSIVLELRRKLPDEQAESLRHASEATFKDIARKLARMAEDAKTAVANLRPTPVAGLNDRAQDNWEPLLSIADYAGGQWPTRARSAAQRLSGVEQEELSLNAQLLADIKDVFERWGQDRIPSSQLIRMLCDDDEAPWSTYNRGNPIAPRQLSNRLSEFNISSGSIRLGYGQQETAKGYKLTQFKDAFARYLPDGPEQAAQGHMPCATDIPKVPLYTPDAGGDGTDLFDRYLASLEEPNEDAGCAGVTDTGEENAPE